MTLAPGTRIATRYVVEAPIGEGGMATVYRVRHAELGTRFALKLLDQRSREVQARLVEEGRMQARLQHPNVVSVVDVVDQDGSPGLVMEYVDGPSLQELIDSRRPIPPAVLDAIVTGVLHGVRAAHNAGFVHRDLKPGNILLARVDDRIVAKVADFGLARAVTTDEDARRTRTGMVFGTPVYMAPEQARNAKDADARADVFALGVVLYELVTGRVPVDSDDFITLYTGLSTRDYPRPRDLAPDLPPHREAAILGALAPDRDQRIPDCGTLLAAWRGEVAYRGEPVEIERTHPFDSAFLAQVHELTELREARSRHLTARPPPALQAPGGGNATVLVALGLVGASAALVAVGFALFVGVAGVACWATPTAPPVAVAAPRSPPSPLVAAPSEPQPLPAPPPPAPSPPSPGPRPVDPAPPSAAPAPAPALGDITLLGDPADHQIFDASGRESGTKGLRAGTYRVVTTFRDGGRSVDTTVKLAPGQQAKVNCVRTFGSCRLVD